MPNKTCGECKHFDWVGQCNKVIEFNNVHAPDKSCSFFEPLTNGDKIRQMSNEELAIEFATVTDCGNCDDCPVKDYCTTECCDPIPAWVAYFNAPAESEVEGE